jgi:hypothetical protein
MFQSHQDGNLDSPVKGKKKSVNNPLVPVMIRQIHQAYKGNPEDEEEFFIDGRPVTNVSFIGQIVGAHPQTTQLVYGVDDGTSEIDVKMWIDSNDPNNFLLHKSEDWQPGVYVKVVGAIRDYLGKKSITGHNIMPLADFNQLVYHQLDAILVHVQATKGGNHQPQRPQFQQQQQNNNNQQKPQQQQQQNNQQQQQNNNQQQNNGDNFGSLHQNVYDFFVSAPTSTGLSVTEVYQHFVTFATKEDLNSVMSYLIDEGHLYKTTDDDHYAVTGDSA